jgi:hypothetical protein
MNREDVLARSLILLHPHLHGYRHFLPELLEHSQRTPIFVTVEVPHTDGEGLLDSIALSLIDQHAIQPDLSARSWPNRIQAVSAALEKIAPYCLFIDAIDWLDSETGGMYLAQLVDQLPDGSQIILNGRQLPIQLLEQPVIREQITLAPIDESAMLIDYLQPRQGKHLLEVFALGPGRALVDGRPITHWDGMLPRTLFLHLVDRGMATRDSIFGAFWPAHSIREATNVFHVTKRKINEILGFDLTIYRTGYYQLSSDIELNYDVVKFGEAFARAHGITGPGTITRLERVIHLYRADFLTGLDQEWAHTRRAELRGMYHETLLTLAELYHESGQPARAANLHRRAMLVGRAS